MNPIFAAAVDPIFLRVLAVLDNASGNRVEAEGLHHELQAKFVVPRTNCKPDRGRRFGSMPSMLSVLGSTIC